MTLTGNRLWTVRHQEVIPNRPMVQLCHAEKVLTSITGETIPIRLFLGGFDLTPTFREVNKKFSTRYYLSLVLIDEGWLREALLVFTTCSTTNLMCRCTTILQTVGDCALPPTARDCRGSRTADPNHRRTTARSTAACCAASRAVLTLGIAGAVAKEGFSRHQCSIETPRDQSITDMHAATLVLFRAPVRSKNILQCKRV